MSKGQFENLYPSDTVLVISRWVDRFYMWRGVGVGVTIIKEKIGSDGVCYILCFTDHVKFLALHKLYALFIFRTSDYLFLGSSFQMGKICMYI